MIARPTAGRQRREGNVRCMAGLRAASMKAPGHWFICRCPARDWAADEFPGLDGRPSLRGGRDGVCCQSGTATATIQAGRRAGARGQAFCTMSASRTTVPDVCRFVSVLSLDLPNSYLIVRRGSRGYMKVMVQDLSAFYVLRHQSSFLA